MKPHMDKMKKNSFLKLTERRNGKDLIKMIEQGIPIPREKKKRFYCPTHKKNGGGGNGPD